MRGEMNSNWYETSLPLKISLGRSVSSLSVFKWIETKLNSNWYGFHIDHFDQNENSNRHKIFCEQNLSEAKWITAHSLDIAFNALVRLKLIESFISLQSF